jgi:hypothetical protein
MWAKLNGGNGATVLRLDGAIDGVLPPLAVLF